MIHHHYISNITLILTCMISLIYYEISATIYTLIARDKTLDRTPYRIDSDAFNYHVCISRCKYDTECNSFAYTPGTPLGTCTFFDVALEMGDQSMTMVTNPGAHRYTIYVQLIFSSVLKYAFDHIFVTDIFRYLIKKQKQNKKPAKSFLLNKGFRRTQFINFVNFLCDKVSTFGAKFEAIKVFFLPKKEKRDGINWSKLKR